MMDFIENIANNDLILTCLVILLIVLVIIFFIVLLFGGKKDKNQDLNVTNNNMDNQNSDENINFDHEEYIKETTAEFELAPINEITPADDNIVVEDREESPAYDVKNTSNILPDSEITSFNFDELSKMISEELEKTDVEDTPRVEEEKEANIPQVTFVDTFKEIESEVKPLEIEKPNNVQNVFEKENIDVNSPSFIDRNVETAKNDDIILPKLAKELINKNISEENKEPVIKENNTPLYVRFNQETYEINEKD